MVFSHNVFHILGIDCFKPANGETAVIHTKHNIPVDVSLPLLKRETSKSGKIQLYGRLRLSYLHIRKKGYEVNIKDTKSHFQNQQTTNRHVEAAT